MTTNAIDDVLEGPFTEVGEVAFKAARLASPVRRSWCRFEL